MVPMDEVPAALPFALFAAGKTDVGRKRDHNEDTILLRPDVGLYLLADGAGGHNAGEVASALATTSIANFFEATEKATRRKPEVDDFGLWTGERRVGAAVKKANRDIIEIATASNKHKGMGTTIVVLTVSPQAGMIHVAHVGDSRCYRLRNGALEQLTQDHSLIVDVLELRPEIDDETLARLPANVITRALGMDPNVRVSIRSHQLAFGDRYLLCSDGLSNPLTHRQIAATLGLDAPVDDVVDAFIDLANGSGGDDNIAALIVACAEGTDLPRIEDHRAAAGARLGRLARTTSEDSAPEIMIIGIEELDVEPNIRVLPARSMTAGQQDAVEHYAAPMRRSSPPSQSEHAMCAHCGQILEGDFCPFCGTKRKM
jgi:PPM family protein phosphatase